MRIAIADHEPLQPERIGAMAGTDQFNAALCMADDADAPQDEGAHDDLADIGLVRDQAAKIGAFDPNDPALLAGSARHEDLTIIEEIHLTRKLPGAVHREDARCALKVGLEDFDGAVKDEEEVDAALPTLEEQGTGRHALLPAVRRDRPRHFLVQTRKGLCFPRIRVSGIEREFGRAIAGGHELDDSATRDLMRANAFLRPTYAQRAASAPF